MDFDYSVLQPATVWVEGSCYRKLPIRYPAGGDERDDELEEAGGTGAMLSDDEPATCAIGGDRVDGVGERCATATAAANDDTEHTTAQHEDTIAPVVQVEGTAAAMFKCTVPCAPAFFGRIVGRGGEGRKRLEAEHACNVRIPPPGSQQASIEVSGGNGSKVSHCRNSILLIVAAARQRMPPTHFVSLPLNAQSVTRAFDAFKRDVMHCCNEQDKDTVWHSLNKGAKLHLTLCVMVLCSQHERDAAADALRLCVEQFVRSSPPLQRAGAIGVHVRGLRIMNDDPGAVDVLYADVQTVDAPHSLLQALCDHVSRAMAERSDAVVRSYGRCDVKLHATLINTRYAADKVAQSASVPGGGVGRPRRVTFDARPILANMAQFDFGRLDVAAVHLSQRHTDDKETGYYLPTTVVPFN